MNENYADALGYNQDEMETYLGAYIARFAKEQGLSEADMTAKLKHYYNGYRFSARDLKVYNPFSILCAIDEKKLKNYWFETGTPTFLVNLLKEKQWYLPRIEGMQATEAVFSSYELENLKPQALLFQTGYITIKDVSEGLYTFDYPNQEIKTAFLETLLHSFTQGISDESRFVLLAGYLYRENFDQFFEIVRAIFASIPYTLETKRDEAYFHTLFYFMICASGADASSEILTSDGRIDLAVEFSDKIFLMEFKCNQSTDAAIKQIRALEYDLKFKSSGKKIIRMGINFDTDKRNVSEWEIEV